MQRSDLLFKALGFYGLYFDLVFKLLLLQHEDSISVDFDVVDVTAEVSLIPAINILVSAFLPLSTNVLEIRHRKWTFISRLRSEPDGSLIFPRRGDLILLMYVPDRIQHITELL